MANDGSGKHYQEGAFNIYLLKDQPFLQEERTLDIYSPYNQAWADYFEQASLTYRLIDDRDIEVFDWATQEMVLQEAAAARVLQDHHDHHLFDHLFVVTLAEKRLYGGYMMFQGAARLVRIPALYMVISGDQRMLALHPSHPPSASRGNSNLLRNEAMRAYFSEIGKLG
jgi:hypothetical protein